MDSNTGVLIATLRERGIVDPRVLDAIARTPREVFLPADLRAEAYLDLALPIECKQTISQPFVVAYMTERLKIEPEHDVLEVGTGSGYQAAILALLARHVFTIERHELLHLLAVQRFRDLGLTNITAILGNGMLGWPEEGRSFERIMVTAAAREVPEPLIAQLKPGGMMIAPVGGRKVQKLSLVTRKDEAVETEELLAVRFVPLLEGAAPPDE